MGQGARFGAPWLSLERGSVPAAFPIAILGNFVQTMIDMLAFLMVHGQIEPHAQIALFACEPFAMLAVMFPQMIVVRKLGERARGRHRQSGKHHEIERLFQHGSFPIGWAYPRTYQATKGSLISSVTAGPAVSADRDWPRSGRRESLPPGAGDRVRSDRRNRPRIPGGPHRRPRSSPDILK